MKSIVLASALAAAGLLVGSASGRPLNHKRKLVTETVFVTETVANVVVYVDQTGLSYSTSTSNMVASITSSAVSTPTTISEVLQAPVSSATPAPAPVSSSSTLATSATSSVEPTAVIIKETSSSSIPTPTPAPESSSEAPSQPAPQSSAAPDVTANTANADSLPLGITWDAYSNSAQCKSEAEIVSDFSKMKDYKIIRVYGSDCDQINLAVREALKNGQKLFGAAYLKSSGNGINDVTSAIESYKNAVNQYAGGNWDVLQMFSVENERVDQHELTASQVIDAINTARTRLRSVGYNGPVGAVETAPAMISNPAICEASDIVMCNIHAFFDRNTQASDAGTFVKEQVNQVRAACGNKRVVVAESGWPHQGDPNGAAVPSPDNQRKAIDSIRANFNSDMFLFSAFDTEWKADTASTFNAERYWGTIQ